MMKLLAFIVLAMHAGRVGAYPKGAPAGVCETMMPNHGDNNADQTIEIKVEPHQKCYKENSNIMVLITPPQNTLINGVLAVSRAIDGAANTAEGTWNPGTGNRLKGVDCFSKQGSGITHSERINTYGPIGLIWQAPAQLEKNVTFLVTVVSVKNTFWVARRSLMNIVFDTNCQQEVYTVPAYKDESDADPNAASINHVIALPLVMACAAVLANFINKLV